MYVHTYMYKCMYVVYIEGLFSSKAGFFGSNNVARTFAPRACTFSVRIYGSGSE